MEIQKNNIAFVTLLLAIVAGYCDTATFVAAKEIFSAHVTGNFIVFAYQIVKGTDASAFIKLITFPVFIIAVIVGGKIIAHVKQKYFLLLLQGLLLLAVGIVVYLLQRFGLYSEDLPMYTCTMFIVFAMGFQNAFGRLFGKETFGPTTMMTGNVTQASLDLGDMMSKSAPRHGESLQSFKKQMTTIAGFLIGCILGAVIGNSIGLIAVCFPGIALVICYYRIKNPSA